MSAPSTHAAGVLEVRDVDPLQRIRDLVHAEPLPSFSGNHTHDELSQLCTAVDRAMPAAGAGMTLAVQGSPGLVLAASGSVAERLEELQITLGEGPCVDAVLTRRPVLEPDLEGSGAHRWPAYAGEASSLGVRAVFAFPLQVGAACLGGLDVYRLSSGSLTQIGLVDALAFAEVAFGILLDGEANSAESGTVGGPEEMVVPHVLYQAQGMVMVQLEVSLHDALARIRAHAFAQDQRLGSVAHDIVSGSLVLNRDDL